MSTANERRRGAPVASRRFHTILWTLVLAAATAPGWSEAPADPAPDNSRTVVIAPQYEANGFHRLLWGTDYRGLWASPVSVDVLDLDTFAGGLKPLFRVGGQETKALAMRGADGRDYTFRGIDKDPISVLPEQLRDTWAAGIVRDQIAANHPASFLVADELMKAAGILHTEQRIVVMPDDAALGEFRKDFAGVVGQVYEFPGAVSDKNPGFHGATEILKHDAFYERIQADPRDRADARAFLKARLLDILIGDWDRHRDQWRWASLPGKKLWEPIPDDRDEAFSRFEGVVPTLARPRMVILQEYGDSYPAMKGLTWNGWEQDRELLAGLERPVWEETAGELKAEITDEVIEKAARRMPAEYFKLDGQRLIHDLERRRDRLLDGAAAFYLHIADKVRVHLTDASEYVEVKRLDGGDTLVQAWPQGPDAKPAGEPFFRRRLHRNETQEVQIYLGDGNDRVVTLGKPNGIEVRVIGGPGRDVVDDTNGGGTRFSGTSPGELLKGPGSHLDGKNYVPPAPNARAPWIPPRDWGRDTFFAPWLSYGSDLGLLLGAGVDTRAFGFRKDPYAARHVLRAGWSFGESNYRADYKAELRFENRGLYLGWNAYASGIESSRFFGFGNQTSDAGNQNSDFFRVEQQQYSLTPFVAIPVARNLTLALGPSVKYASSKKKEEATLINDQQPYGYGDFGELGATGVLELDTREATTKTPGGVALRSVGYPRSGTLVRIRGEVWPGVWDVKETFGSVKGTAAAYLTPGGRRAPTLALRVGGEKVFGSYPFFEAAYLGSGRGDIGSGDTEGLVRGLQRRRYAGDATLYGNADLRLYVSRFRLLLPGEWGLLGFGDGGRVYLDGESSDKWHYGYGGGLWFAWLDRANAISLSYARSEGRNALYVRAGFAF